MRTHQRLAFRLYLVFSTCDSQLLFRDLFQSNFSTVYPFGVAIDDDAN